MQENRFEFTSATRGVSGRVRTALFMSRRAATELPSEAEYAGGAAARSICNCRVVPVSSSVATSLCRMAAVRSKAYIPSA